VGVRGRAMSRTVTRKRRRRRKLRSGIRGRRNSLFRMTFPSPKLIGFKNVVEIAIDWDLTKTITATGPKVVTGPSVAWMAPPGTNEFQEAMWNATVYRKLKSVTYRFNNIRTFITTTTTLPAQGSAPPVTDTQTVEMPEWVFWYYKNMVDKEATPPNANDESRYTKLCKKNCYSGIWGKVPLNYKKMSWVTGSYATNFTKESRNTVLENYLADHGATVYGLGTTPTIDITNRVSTGTFWIMPDDPYPSSFYTDSTITRTVRISVVADCTTYTKWKIFKNSRS